MPVCALVGATDFNEEHFLSQHFDSVIAVDAGYAHLARVGVEPRAIVGDFDSLGYVPEAGCVKRYPAEKDQSDMELALRLALERGFDTIVVYAALAGRLDHTLANIQVMAAYARRGACVFGVGDSFVLAVLDGAGFSRLRFDAFDPSMLDAGEYGRFVSAFALGGCARGVCESGLKYSLAGADVPFGVSLGLSNEFTGEPAQISVSEGSVVVTFSLGAWNFLKGC